jgi:hypothetical protein
MSARRAYTHVQVAKKKPDPGVRPVNLELVAGVGLEPGNDLRPTPRRWVKKNVSPTRHAPRPGSKEKAGPWSPACESRIGCGGWIGTGERPPAPSRLLSGSQEEYQPDVLTPHVQVAQKRPDPGVRPVNLDWLRGLDPAGRDQRSRVAGL